ncbi:unnamed protein product [Parajaminaea phylloscopi]
MLTPTPNAALGVRLEQCPRYRHILTGTFNTVFLHLLTFDSLTNGLNVTLSVPAQGPHQYLALGSIGASTSSSFSTCGSSSWDSNSRVVYATTWADDRRVSAWRVSLRDGSETIEHINSQPITAAGSYLTVQPPPYDSLTSPSYGVPSVAGHNGPGEAAYLYQVGGPTGEVFAISPETGAIGEQVQKLIFLPGGQAELDGGADTSRKSLRYGAHNIDFDVHGLGYVADLGRNAILVYARDSLTGAITLRSQASAPHDHDGPRHVVPSPDGRWVFSVTEHTSFVDAYRVNSAAGTLSFRQRSSVLPRKALAAGTDRADWRGDTLRLSPSGQHLFATTRGANAAVKGWIAIWELDLDSETAPLRHRSWRDASGISATEEVEGRYAETSTSGGKANALEWAPRHPLSLPGSLETGRAERHQSKDWAVLTDDEQGFLSVLEWDGDQLREVAKTRLPGVKADGGFIAHNGVQAEVEGASHAIWLD